ncbi:uncharacterized protein BYT42DRAFT_573319 [Radiomyces spectabilis]|uniref:uncharacterized protein n=1 Tax=Radiomyces spectabilis TaxID=64574 RepID=UPI00221F1AFE|nr:uncharacterized protein BYT42DRAFT_573319 [Radiomyces spectabilis]KAI8376077.1 hypothetical protein BYT42DRAFT_573319 [Radiomyces spectabilis]
MATDLQPKPEKSKVKEAYDKEALKARWRLLGRDPEQSILSLIRRACYHTFARDDWGKVLQGIKASFVQRDYEGIFTDEENLQVYSAAYVPGRALCYFEIFSRPQLRKLLGKACRIFAVGSGSGSELVSVAAAMTRVPAERQQVRLNMQDIGAWSSVLTCFETTIRQEWKLTTEQLECVYEQGDVLSKENESRRNELIAQADLITFMFVMNELFVNKTAAMQLIQTLIQSMKKGALLLIVESAGSFSHLQIGGKTYMLYTLLDAVKDLECVVAEDSRWYR